MSDWRVATRLSLPVTMCVTVILILISFVVSLRVAVAGNLVGESDSPVYLHPHREAGMRSFAAMQSGEDANRSDDDWGDDDWDAEQGPSRLFFYKELVLSGFYSLDGAVGVPPDDGSRDRFELSPRPPANYLGVDLVKTFGPSSCINTCLLPDWLPLSAIDLHPRIVHDRMETSGSGKQWKFAPQDFWVRFNPGQVDRLLLRIGQFVIPYGVNPILAPRQRFILPLEATDLGLKWDWGVDLKGPIGEYDWEVAATIGSGETLHSPQLFRNWDSTSFLVTGRIGAPTYWDFQYGLSFLAGDIPVIRATKHMSRIAISRWRVGVDTFHKYGTYLMFGSQLTYGQDGFAGDERFVGLSGGTTADVLGIRGWVDWVVPWELDLRLAAQFESVNRDVSLAHTDDSAVILEATYSLTTLITFVLDHRIELNRSMGNENDAFYLTFVYYGS